jgi:type III restriction enzyme
LITIGIKAPEDEIKNRKSSARSLNSRKYAKKLIPLFPRKRKSYKIHLHEGVSQESFAFAEALEETRNLVKRKICLTDFEFPIIRKAFQKIPFYQFANLKKYIPELDSIHTLYQPNKYLGNIEVEIDGFYTTIHHLDAKLKLNVTVSVLINIADDYSRNMQGND